MMDSSINTNKDNNLEDSKFDDIRPLYDSEVKETIDFLLNDKWFKTITEPLIAPTTWDDFSKHMRSLDTIYDFQTKVIYDFILKFIKGNVDHLSLVYPPETDLNKSYTFMSNHRDIILDAGLFNISLQAHGYKTTEIAIGDNLLIYPWITALVKLNKSFIVKRNIPPRQVLEASQHLSEYMHWTISHKKQSTWIAQREGRAKDSNDRTQASLLKMLTLVDRKNPIESIKALNIAPLSISYEYDPCDFLKAQEFQLKRDISDYKKTDRDDLTNMMAGLQGHKGRICFRVCKPLNERIDTIDSTQSRATILQDIANLIDEEIFRNYEIYTINYIAHDMLKNTDKFSAKYTSDDKDNFIAYVNKQIGKIQIENKDYDFLKHKIIEMYANELINQLSAQE